MKYHDLQDLQHILTFDIDHNMIYKLYLNSISKYKMDDLKQIASEYQIPVLKNNGKKKVKKELYDDINLYKLLHD